jgi:polynucleotide kinase-phosphatase
MSITLPELSLVLLVGASGSGKSTFARQHFLPTEVLSSDFCRGLVADDENDQSATGPAFEVLHFVAAKRLAAGRLTVIDATNVQPEARKPLLELAREYHVLPVAIVFHMPEALCQERNQQRPDRSFGAHVVRNQQRQLRRSLSHLKREGFSHVFTFKSPEEVAAASITRQPLWVNRRNERGPFDLIGDIHGCYDELRALLDQLGYAVQHDDAAGTRRYTVQHPDGRRVIFVGDLVDRGPATPEVLRLAMDMVDAGVAFCVPGNHDDKLLRALRGHKVKLSHGLSLSLEQLEREPPDFRARVAAFLDSLVSHYVLDDGWLVVAHAGMPEALQGRASRKVRDFALYGETTGETDEFGLPVRYPWAQNYRGAAMVVYGHTPVPEPEWINRTVNIDTGCVFGERLTALRYPEREFVSVAAAQAYSERGRPIVPQVAPRDPSVLDIGDVMGKRIIETGLGRRITIRAEQAAAALEVMSRYATDPRWLIYLPPTMAPTETSEQPDLLEHPAEAFAFYRSQGIETVICEEKHMGSRAVVVVCRDLETARRRFGMDDGSIGAIYTRTGRPFFGTQAQQTAMLDTIRGAVARVGLWETLQTDWLCLDCEILPWTLKARELVRVQYAAVGAAASAALPAAVAALEQAAARGIDPGDLLPQTQERAQMVQAYVAAYQRYAPAGEMAVQVAPFHLLASEGAAHTDKTHEWHMQTLAPLCEPEGTLLATPYRLVDVHEAASQEAGIRWWEEITQRGAEGMVVKPLAYVAHGPRGLVQPAVKCRGREYLRIIYGPEYTAPANLERLRERGLGLKRSLALREFALGVEGLARFVQGEPFYRVHECVFGVLALESEPVDPRL